MTAPCVIDERKVWTWIDILFSPFFPLISEKLQEKKKFISVTMATKFKMADLKVAAVTKLSYLL